MDDSIEEVRETIKDLNRWRERERETEHGGQKGKAKRQSMG